MKRVACVVMAGMVLAALSGCVSRSKYDALVARNAEQKDKIDELGRQVDQVRLTASGLRGEVSAAQRALDGARVGVSERDAQIGVLSRRTTDLEARVTKLADELSRPPKVVTVVADAAPEPEPVVLPEAVKAALRDLAAREPIFTFDERTGCCRFTSDVLFETGTATVSADFERVLGRFAAIFGAAGKACHLRIVGHTDSQPIRNIGTRTSHPTNWHLSVHRAIEVMRVLYKGGIDQDRFEVVGYGSQRPIAANTTAVGRAQNRRVEIFVFVPTGRVAHAVGPPEPLGGE